jgi:hypothetical protein
MNSATALLLAVTLGTDPLTPGDHTSTLVAGGRERSYLVHVPLKPTSASAMIEWLRDWLGSPYVSPPALISLRHDLESPLGPDEQSLHPGDGGDVARFLATQKPFCHVIVHTSNGPAGSSMMCCLQDAGWQATRMCPENSLEWVKSHWVGCAFRLIYEWDEQHPKTA